MNKYRDTVAKAKAATSDLPVSEDSEHAEHEPLAAHQRSSTPKTTTRTRAKERQAQRTPVEMTTSSIAHILTTPTVPMTTRYEPELAEALKRAALEQRASRRYPHTLQAIQNEAARMWLWEHGYLKHERAGNE